MGENSSPVNKGFIILVTLSRYCHGSSLLPGDCTHLLRYTIAGIRPGKKPEEVIN